MIRRNLKWSDSVDILEICCFVIHENSSLRTHPGETNISSILINISLLIIVFTSVIKYIFYYEKLSGMTPRTRKISEIHPRTRGISYKYLAQLDIYPKLDTWNKISWNFLVKSLSRHLKFFNNFWNFLTHCTVFMNVSDIV